MVYWRFQLSCSS